MTDNDSKTTQADKTNTTDEAAQHSSADADNSGASTAEKSSADQQDLNQQDIDQQQSGNKQTEQLSQHKPPVTDTAKGRQPVIKKLSLIALAILVLAIICAASFWGYHNWPAKTDEQSALVSISTELQKVRNEQAASDLANKQNAQSQQRRTASSIAAIEKRIAASEQRLKAHNKRLLSLSTTTREDWLLAEAEYLLKLANQRVLIERSASAAISLLVQADSIFRDLDDPDLFPLRQALAKDLAALRLAKEIDVEGIYLTLTALSEQVENLPLRHSWEEISKPSTSANNEAREAEALELTVQNALEQSRWQKLKQGFADFVSGLDSYVRITDHSYKAELLLEPNSAMYLQQNLRLILERSQLALLREEKEIYQSSLAQAKNWLMKYYPKSASRLTFVTEIEKLHDQKIIRELPNITGSLELLRAYIERLHKLGESRKPETPKP